jgi:cell division septation protein DedD
MRGFAGFSNRMWPLAALGCLLAGCGVGRAPAPALGPDHPAGSPTLPSEEPARRTPAEARVGPSDFDPTLLPGALRVYPSQDPRALGTGDAAFAGSGSTQLRPETPTPEAADPKFGYSVQLFASGSRDLAARRLAEIRHLFAGSSALVSEGGVYRVRVGGLATRQEAENLRRKAESLGFRDAFVVAPVRASEGAAEGASEGTTRRVPRGGSR